MKTHPFVLACVMALPMIPLPHARGLTVAEATDWDAPWQTAGWSPSDTLGLDGIDAAVTPWYSVSSPNASHSLTTTVGDGATTLYFSYMWRPPTVASVFTIWVNGAPINSGVLPSHVGEHWQEASIPIPAGGATVMWLFETRPFGKNAGGQAGLDQVWTNADPRPRITATTAPQGEQAKAFSWEVPVASTAGAALSATGLPPGLTVHPDTHVISGIPSASGIYEATLTATNSMGRHVATSTFVISGPPQLILERAVEAPLANGDSYDFGGFQIGYTQTPTFTIRNTGVGSLLTGVRVAITGPSAAEFEIRTDPAESVPGPTGTTTFTIGFTPNAPGPKTASLLISSNDPDDNPFEVVLTALTPPLPDVDQDGLPDTWERTYWTSIGGHSATDDADGDGYTELAELAFGLNPAKPDAGGKPPVTIEAGYLTMTLTKRPGIFYQVQSAGASNSFTAADTTILIETPSILKVRDNVLVGAAPARFLRAIVTPATEQPLPPAQFAANP